MTQRTLTVDSHQLAVVGTVSRSRRRERGGERGGEGERGRGGEGERGRGGEGERVRRQSERRRGLFIYFFDLC